MFELLLSWGVPLILVVVFAAFVAAGFVLALKEEIGDLLSGVNKEEGYISPINGFTRYNEKRGSITQRKRAEERNSKDFK